jgi:hypothetical protein
MDQPKLTFTYGFDENDEFETQQRGYCDHVVVDLPTRLQYRVIFYEPVRLAQSLETLQESGKVCLGEPGLIVVPTVTLHYMQEAVNQLYKEGYFEHLAPLKQKVE